MTDKEEHDFCECGGELDFIGRDKDDVLMAKCKECNKTWYNEADL